MPPFVVAVLIAALMLWSICRGLSARPPAMTARQRRILENYFLYYGRLDAAGRARFERLVMGL